MLEGDGCRVVEHSDAVTVDQSDLSWRGWMCFEGGWRGVVEEDGAGNNRRVAEFEIDPGD